MKRILANIDAFFADPKSDEILKANQKAADDAAEYFEKHGYCINCLTCKKCYQK